MAESRIKIIGAISDWLKLLALVVLIAEVAILAAMKLTPPEKSIHSYYPIFLLGFLVIVVLGIFFDRYLSSKKVADRLESDPVTKEPTENEVAKREASDIVGVWGDSFMVRGQKRASLIRIYPTDCGYSIEGQEFDENYDELYHWQSALVDFDNVNNVEYFFIATRTHPGDLPKKIYGRTNIHFFGSGSNRFQSYKGTFEDFEITRTAHINGEKISDAEESFYDTSEGKRILVEKLINKK